jgi:hypothetical protein
MADPMAMLDLEKRTGEAFPLPSTLIDVSSVSNNDLNLIFPQTVVP